MSVAAHGWMESFPFAHFAVATPTHTTSPSVHGESAVFVLNWLLSSSAFFPLSGEDAVS